MNGSRTPWSASIRTTAARGQTATPPRSPTPLSGSPAALRGRWTTCSTRSGPGFRPPATRTRLEGEHRPAGRQQRGRTPPLRDLRACPCHPSHGPRQHCRLTRKHESLRDAGYYGATMTWARASLGPGPDPAGRRPAPFPRACGSVPGRLVEDHDEADDLAVADAEVVRQDEVVGQAGLVEIARVGPADDGVAVV